MKETSNDAYIGAEHDSHGRGQNAMKYKNWLPLCSALALGITLGVAMFSLVHRWEPGFTNAHPTGVIIDEDPINTLLHSWLDSFGLCVGAFVVIAGAVLVLSRRVVVFGHRAGFAVAVLGAMMVSQAGLQLRFDEIYPSAAAIDQLARDCNESAQRPCITVPPGDR